MDYKIVIDSCGEFLPEWSCDERFASVPLILTVDGEEIIDDETFHQPSFLKKVADSSSCPQSSCPSPESYLRAYDGDSRHIYVVTLSASLSGSHNSALMGKALYLESHPDAMLHVFNSRSASVGQTLIAERIALYEEQGLPFETIIERVEHYIEGQHTYFVLEDLETLRKNGRLGRVKGLVASALKIKPVMGSTQDGNIQLLGQSRGMGKALRKMVDFIEREAVETEHKILGITHCNCLERALMLREELLSRLPFRDTVILDTGGVSSMYANDGGVIVVV